jgi:hypothetical protein
VEIIESEEMRLLDARLKEYKRKSNIVMMGIPILMLSYFIIFNLIAKILTNKMQVV